MKDAKTIGYALLPCSTSTIAFYCNVFLVICIWLVTVSDVWWTGGMQIITGLENYFHAINLRQWLFSQIAAQSVLETRFSWIWVEHTTQPPVLISRSIYLFCLKRHTIKPFVSRLWATLRYVFQKLQQLNLFSVDLTLREKQV